MSKVYIPQDYHTPLSVYEMQRAIEFIKSNFQVNLSNALNLRRVSAPLFVDENSGLNDNLNGVERPVSFDIPDVGTNAQVVHSLAKWKRLALKRYDFKVGKGLFTDMNAIRRDEEVDNLHSIYVDQWDWEKVISAEDRNVAYLKRTVRDIVSAVSETSSALNVAFPSLHTKLPSEVFFITTQELEDLYPDLTPKQREDEICKKKGVVFLMQIGKILKSGIKHDGRAPDYDDWELNGDILYWNEVLGHAFEISSMGIRVDPKSLDSQLTIAGCDDRRELPFHKAVLNGELPYTMGDVVDAALNLSVYESARGAQLSGRILDLHPAGLGTKLAEQAALVAALRRGTPLTAEQKTLITPDRSHIITVYRELQARRWHAEDLQPLCAKLGEENTGKTLVAVTALEQVGLIATVEKGGANYLELVPAQGKKNLADAPILKCLEGM